MNRFAIALVALALAVPAVATGSTAFVPDDPLVAEAVVPRRRSTRSTTGPTSSPTWRRCGWRWSTRGSTPTTRNSQGRIAASQSFVGGGIDDKHGHGTFVAGVIAAAADNGEGIAGIAFPAELLIAKVVRSDGTISPEAEAKAIRWAADNGARVINLSLGGLRDPIHRDRDTFSEVEARAVSYAYSKGAVLVAAVGNGDEAPKSPWPYASYPAALPHVLGVSALTAERLGAGILEPRQGLQRHLRAWGRDRLDAAAGADREPPELPRPGLLAVRAARVPQRGRHVLRRRRRCRRPRRCSSPRTRRWPRPGDGAARALGSGRQRGHRLHALRPAPRPAAAAGGAWTSPRR